MAHPLYRFIPLALLLSGAAFPASAQAREDSQLWTTIGANLKLGGKWRLSQDVQLRVSDERGFYHLQSNTLVGYQLRPDVTVAAGYVHNPLYADGDRVALEHRFREQITLDNLSEAGPGKLSARLRAEQRWRDNTDGTAWRVRPYLRYSIPIVGKTDLRLSTETFLNLNRTAFQGTRGFDRVRNQLSVSTRVSSAITAEGGYVNQRTFVRNGPDRTDHVGVFVLTFAP